MAEHTLGKGEVESSILSHSTILIYFQYAFGLKFAAPEVKNSDMLEAWSNGLLLSTPHRVLNLSPERFSLPYFVAANYNTIIQPFDGLANEERPELYQPFMAGAHLERMLMRDFPYLRRLKTSRGAAQVNPIHNPFEQRLNKKKS